MQAGDNLHQLGLIVQPFTQLSFGNSMLEFNDPVDQYYRNVLLISFEITLPRGDFPLAEVERS